MKKLLFLSRTAIRDSRKDIGKLVMFMSSIVIGIAALVAINSFNYNLLKDVDEQAATLLGADIAVNGNRELTGEIGLIVDSIPGERSSEIEIFSMSYLKKTDDSQFVRVKALEGNFPFYGELKTDPPEAYNIFRNEKGALVDDGMMLQYGLQVGDSIRLGESTFVISGRLQSLFGGFGGSGFAPTVYIGLNDLDSTKLVQPGSLLDYAFYFKVPEGFDPDAWQDQYRSTFRDESYGITTIQERREDLNEAFSSLNYFLNLVALVSLLLGCIGVASSVMIYIKNKIPSIAVLRCIGMKGMDAFRIYFFQILLLGILGVIAGAAAGSAVQVWLPEVFKGFLPYEVNMSISWRAILEGFIIGIVITTLFALIPLVGIRKISPLRTLRSSVDEERPRDPVKWLIFAAIVLSLFCFLWKLTGVAKEGFVFSLSLVVAFLVLFLVSKLIIWGVKRFFPRNWHFVLRQGLANLYRPNNQTQTLLVSIGLGTAVLTTLFIIQGLLLENVQSMDAGNQPNMILFGIERDQTEALAEITNEYNLPIIQQVPIVTMKLAGWQGRSREDWLADTTRSASRWAINREARVTFRDSLLGDEKLVSGEFTGSVDPGDSIFVSLATNYADALDVEIGDELVWNVQGAMITTYVGSTREIQFNSMSTRFFIVFPTGVLEEAPQSRVLVTKSPDTETTARYRSEVVKAFPNVSVIDLGMILKALNDILSKVSYVIQFMAAFSILTGLIVLLSSLLLSKYQRIKESVLLRTIGAVRRQIFRINATEYALLGSLSAATGILIALAGSYILATFQLELQFKLNWWPIFAVFFVVVGLTIMIGLLNSREVLFKSPLEVLRKEVG
jgi:putative ABC transport system permease protein